MRTTIVRRPHEKRTALHSQLQAINKLASGVHDLAQVNAKHVKVENQDRQQLLEFRREEAGKTRKHGNEVTELYLKMMMVQQSNNFGKNFSQQSQMM